MVEFIIRSLTSTEEPAILEVYRGCEDFLALGPQPYASLEMIRKDIEEVEESGGVFTGIFIKPDQADLKSNENWQLAGVLGYIPNGFENEPDLAFIELLMIAAPHRSQGLGSAVLSWLEDLILQVSGITRVQLGVQINNPDGLRFWQRHGYQVIGPPKLYPDQTTAVRMEKKFI
jgi:ribosomal protein S18 acetylase RimI-like enzyme